MKDSLMSTNELRAKVDELGLSVASEFVPYERSRSYKPGAKLNDLSLNWKVSLQRNGKTILTTDYTVGIAHCPSYTHGKMYEDQATAVRYECDHGKKARLMPSIGNIMPGAAIKPNDLDVIHSLVSDSDVLDHNGFESWAGDLEYDTDSRKAEDIYRACLDIALALRNGIGESGLQQLREACQDY